MYMYVSHDETHSLKKDEKAYGFFVLSSSSPAFVCSSFAANSLEEEEMEEEFGVAGLFKTSEDSGTVEAGDKRPA